MQSIPAFPTSEAGIGLRSAHYNNLLETLPAIGWLEIHPENYFGGGAPRHYLAKAREHYPLSFHATGLSLGSDQPVDEAHLARIKELASIYEPFQVSDHASWSASGNAHLNDLLPLPYTQDSLVRLADNVDRAQTVLKRRILVENPSTYLMFSGNEMSEPAFLNALAAKTGCGLLLDVNNIFVQSHNHGFDPFEYIDQIDSRSIGEIHLAGHVTRDFAGGTLLIDSHNRLVCTEVWDLFSYLVAKTGPVPSLIEWDADLPDLATLTGEAFKAQAIIDRRKDRADEAA